ncbi:MAG: YaiO family outer membrane beta-barrel protein [Bacteroidia bacterium]|nr:MAG: YaiO family outer membrane beta-barrel protein [Bacteroidia bacterium]
MSRFFVFIVLIAVPHVHLRAQDSILYNHPEEGFSLMLQYASDKDYATAKQIGYSLLEENEAYHDAALFLARIHGWEASYDSAYRILDQVFAQAPELFEAYQTCVDIAYWENNWERLEQCADKAVELEPDSSEFFDRYRQAQYQGGPEPPWPELFMHYSYDHFSLPYVRNWHMLTVGGQIPVKPGTLVPYVNVGYHAGGYSPATDVQLNLDAYLTLGKKNYAMLGYGFSPNGALNYLPLHRAAAEIWQVLPMGFGLSAGFRYFYWEQHFTFLTFSAEKYAGNYWFSLRNYLFFKDYGTSASFYLSARRYFDTKFDHLTLTLGYGAAPDEPLLVVTDLERLNAISCRVELSKQVNTRVRMSVMLGYAYEEYFDQEYRNRFDLRIGCYFRIKK